MSGIVLRAPQKRQADNRVSGIILAASLPAHVESSHEKEKAGNGTPARVSDIAHDKSERAKSECSNEHAKDGNQERGLGQDEVLLLAGLACFKLRDRHADSPRVGPAAQPAFRETSTYAGPQKSPRSVCHHPAPFLRCPFR